MKNIFKYELPISLKPIIEMPFDAEILSIQMQNGKLQIWAIVDDEDNLVSRQFYVLGTGHGFPNEVEYAMNAGQFKHHSTVQSGSLVWHIFENTMPF